MAGTNLFTPISGTCWVALTKEGKPSSEQLAMLAKCVGTPPITANVFEHGCLMNQTDTATSSPALYQNTGSSASPAWTLLSSGGGGSATSLVDSNAVTALDVTTVASSVNHPTVLESATGAVSANFVGLVAKGSDADVSVTLQPKNNGYTLIGNMSGSGDIYLGASTLAQHIAVAGGSGAPTVDIANITTQGATVDIAGGVTANTKTDTVNVATGNAASGGKKVVNILTGTPVTSGNNEAFIGGGNGSSVTFNAVLTSHKGINIQGNETGANNAIAAALVDAAGVAITSAPGMTVSILLAHTLQAGANTLNLNATSAVAIKSHFNPANDIATAYAVNGLITLVYDGAEWLDTSQ